MILLHRATLSLVFSFSAGVIQAAATEQGDAKGEGNLFFTQQIEPIFRDRCFECHSHASGKMKGGLALDSKAGWSEGGGTGPAVRPGEPDKSLLIEAVRRLNVDTAMPPKKPLTEAEVVLLTEWVRRGAPDPRVTAISQAPNTDWWSLKPLPAVNAKTSGVSEKAAIDEFIQRKLTGKGLTMSTPAGRRALIRRVYFDLHGLAPTPEEVAAFVSDPDPQVYGKLVDHLLASPRYGERWARHWFDTIHFADTHGFEHDEIRENAWRYRDYVIAALNSDTSWPRFIREQLAADVFFPTEPHLTAALGFLGAGPFDLSAAETAPKMFELVDRDDIVVQTLAAFTSTTAGCARCHDHKFDPIPQKDYYALAAVFAGVAKGDLAYDESTEVAKAREKWQSVVSAAQKKDPAVLLTAETQQLTADWESTRGSSAVWEIPVLQEYISSSGAPFELRDDGSIVSTGTRPDKETLTLTTKPNVSTITAVRLEAMADPALPKSGPGRQDNGNFHLNECEIFVVPKNSAVETRRIRISRGTADFNQDGWTVTHAIDGNEKTGWAIFPRVGESHLAVFELAGPVTLRDGESLRIVLKQVHGAGHVMGRMRIATTDGSPEQLEIIPAAVADALSFPPGKRTEAHCVELAAHVLSGQSARELAKLPSQRKVYAAARSVVRKEKKVAIGEPRVIHLLSRGDLSKPEEVATPGALACIESLPARFALPSGHDEGARRAALADWLADPQNPLTWRSIVNRVWHYHFGRGLVETPNDLGRMGSLPSHPELLDWLAADFRDSGGSLKRLHRQIVLSAVYCQASDAGTVDTTEHPDTENKLLWRANRQRLDAESYRDIVLQKAGDLDLTMGGPSVMHFKLGPPVQNTPTLNYTSFDWNKPGVNRRSIYRLVFRNIADPFMVAMDFPDASQLAPHRPFSASALQALTLWNDSFVLRQSERMARRIEILAPSRCEQVRAAVRLILLRDPRPDELLELTSYAEEHGMPALCRVLINTNEFLFID